MKDTLENHIKGIFSNPMWEEISSDSIFSTSDEKVFLRYEEALKHTQGKLTLERTTPLADPTILEWFAEFTGNDPIPTVKCIVLNNAK